MLIKIIKKNKEYDENGSIGEILPEKILREEPCTHQKSNACRGRK
jgi:hypothetical protein